MNENGARATRLMEQILPYARTVPPGGDLILVNPEDERAEYSVFTMRGFNVLKRGEWLVKKRANRDDITVSIAEVADLGPARSGKGAVVLHLDGDSINVGAQTAPDAPR